MSGIVTAIIQHPVQVSILGVLSSILLAILFIIYLLCGGQY